MIHIILLLQASINIKYYVREAIPTGSKVFYVECNISYCIGNMLFVTNMLESIKDAIEKYKKAKAELSYRDIWGTFKNLMDYIEFFRYGDSQESS